METMTHLLPFVAIDTCVYTLGEDIILDPGGFIDVGKDFSIITRQEVF